MSRNSWNAKDNMAGLPPDGCPDALHLPAAQELEHKSGKRPEIILETTGHYQSPVVQFLGKIGLSVS